MTAHGSSIEGDLARFEQWLDGRSPALLSDDEIEAAARHLDLDLLAVCELGLTLEDRGRD